MNLNDFLKKLTGKQTIAEKLSQSKPQQPIENCKYYFPDFEGDIAMLKTTIAGITHHMNLSDARKPYHGYSKFEPENPYNPKAVSLISDDGRMMGYVPESYLKLYYDIFGHRDHIRFHGAVGIFTNDRGKKTLFGRIMLVDIPPEDDGTLFDLAQKQLDFMMQEFTTE